MFVLFSEGGCSYFGAILDLGLLINPQTHSKLGEQAKTLPTGYRKTDAPYNLCSEMSHEARRVVECLQGAKEKGFDA